MSTIRVRPYENWYPQQHSAWRIRAGGGQVSSLGALEEHIARLYLVQLLRAVQCLHMNGVLHGDLNSATAHVDTAGNVAVRDYG